MALSLSRALISPLQFLPKSIALRLASVYISLLFLFLPRLTETSLTNFTIAFPELSEQERKELLRKSKLVLASNLVGFAKIPSLTKKRALELNKLEAQIELLEEVSNSAPEGVGTLIAALHFDAFEYLIQIPALVYKPFSILGRGFDLPRVDAWWNKRRQMHGNTIFDRKGAVAQINRRLGNGENVIVMCDQNVKKNHAVFANFFGKQAATSKTVALCAMRTGAPIVFAAMISDDEGNIDFAVEPLPSPDSFEGTVEEKIVASTEAMHRAFENHIRKRPEGWFWIHRRWKTRPQGEAEDIYISI